MVQFAVSMDDGTPRRTPRKRAVRKRTMREVSSVDSTGPPRRRAPRSSSSDPPRKPVRKVEEDTSSAEPRAAPERKAPTTLQSKRQATRRRRLQWVVVFLVMAVGVASSAAIGYTDEGQIDVEATIEARNERIRNNVPNENDIIVTSIEVPVQNTPVIDGVIPNPPKGLGIGGPETPPPPPEPATTTATTTDGAASSTDETATSTDEQSEPETELEAEDEEAHHRRSIASLRRRCKAR